MLSLVSSSICLLIFRLNNLCLVSIALLPLNLEVTGTLLSLSLVPAGLSPASEHAVLFCLPAAPILECLLALVVLGINMDVG